MRRLEPPEAPFSPRAALRWVSTVAGGLLWVASVLALWAGWTRGLYMALILVWFLPPILLQLGFGADILWRYRRLVMVGFVPPTLYLWLVDGLAIASGTWTINPLQTLGVDLFHVLPLEEITFFWMTSVVIAFGMVLMLARESHERVGIG